MNRLVYYLALVLVAAQLLLVLVSWMLSAAFTDAVRPLLSAEGLRWFVGGFSLLLLTPLLSWLLLGAMAAGCFARSGVAGLFRRPLDYRRLLALRAVLLIVVVLVVVIVALALVPHAVLLSATGRLWPSPFSDGLVPLLALAVIIVSAVYGLAVRRFAGVIDVLRSLVGGLSASAPLLFIYVLAVQLFESVCFVFMI